MWARLRLRWWSARARMRVIAFAVIFVLANLAGMSAAVAAGDGESSLWNWMEVYDRNGTSAWAYTLSLDTGGITDPFKVIFGGITQLCWFVYQWFVITSIWLIDFALSLSWFEPLKTPVQNIATSLGMILESAGLVNVLLLLTGLVVCCLILRGAWATAIWEFIIAFTVLALGTGVLNNPVDKAVGGADGKTEHITASGAMGNGWLGEANAAGLELAGALQVMTLPREAPSIHTGFVEPAEVRSDISAKMVDTFIRTPHQLINYGKILKDCQSEYNRSLNVMQEIARPPKGYFAAGGQAAGVERTEKPLPEEGDEDYKKWKAFVEYVEVSYGSTDMETLTKAASDILSWNSQKNVDPPEPRNIIKECDEEAGERAANPSAGMAGDAATLGIGSIFLVGLALVMAFSLIYFGIQFLLCALRAVWELVLALGPNRARTGLWQTLAHAMWSLIGVAMTSIFLVTYLLTVREVQQSFDGDEIMKSFLLVDILLAAGLFLYLRLRKHMKNAADRTAGLLGKRPGKPPAKMPGQHGGAATKSGSSRIGPTAKAIRHRIAHPTGGQGSKPKTELGKNFRAARMGGVAGAASGTAFTGGAAAIGGGVMGAAGGVLARKAYRKTKQKLQQRKNQKSTPVSQQGSKYGPLPPHEHKVIGRHDGNKRDSSVRLGMLRNNPGQRIREEQAHERTSHGRATPRNTGSHHHHRQPPPPRHQRRSPHDESARKSGSNGPGRTASQTGLKAKFSGARETVKGLGRQPPNLVKGSGRRPPDESKKHG